MKEIAGRSRRLALSTQTTGRSAFFALLALGTLFVLFERAVAGLRLPVWIDESFTVSAAHSPGLKALTRQIWMDSNAPLHSVAAWLWPLKDIGGLRLLSAISVFGAATLPLIWRSSLNVEQRAAWGALLLFWAPSVGFSLDARPYALLLFFATAQTIAFLRLMETPNRARASIWCGLIGLAVLTHYFALFLGLAQGVAYLMSHRRQAMRTWPSVLTLAPAALVIAWHLPRLAAWSAPGLSWQELLTPKDALLALLLPLGPAPVLAIGTLIVLLACQATPTRHPNRPALIAFASSAACLAALVIAGMLHPFVVTRYLTPTIPGALLGIVLLARSRVGYAAVAAWSLLGHNPHAVYVDLRERAHFGLDEPARSLLSVKPDIVAYTIDCPCAAGFDSQAMVRIGEQTFRDAGLRTQVRWLVVDSNTPRQLLAATVGAQRPAIIWVSNRAAAPPVASLAPGWRCIGFGPATLACALGAPTGAAKK